MEISRYLPKQLRNISHAAFADGNIKYKKKERE